MKNLLSKYYTEYLDSRVIFVLDLLLSMVSAVIVLLVLVFFAKSGHEYYSGTFALWWLGGKIVFCVLTMFMFKSYDVIVRIAGLSDIRKYFFGVFLTDLFLGIMVSTVCIFNSSVIIATLCDFLLTMFLILGIRIIMLDVYRLYKAKVKDVANRHRILVYGTSSKAVAAIPRFRNSSHYNLVGFISNDLSTRNLKLLGFPVVTYQTEQDFKTIVDNYSLYAVLFPSENDVKAEENGLIQYCSNLNVKTLVTPTVDEVIDGKLMNGGIRQVKIEDLLGRPEIKISLDEIRENFHDKVVMVTGAAGSIGSELCRQLAMFCVRQLVLFDNAETPMHNLRLELEARFPSLNFVPCIGSVKHPNRVDYAFRKFRPQVVFHAAAYKHVPLMEENPCEAVLTNVLGSRLVADKCLEYDVEMMVMISTDKAVNPTNIMGCSKRLAEIYVQSLGLAMAKGEVKGKTKFVTTRFGNVLGSNGSVIPRFREQIENGGPVTVTHPDITRFFMTIPEACRLVMEAATMSTGNQIFVFDMGESVKIVDLAKRMIELMGYKEGEDIQIEFTGLRPGEKLYEEVLANSENSEPTSHDRIRIAKVREYEYAETNKLLLDLIHLSEKVEIMEMVKLMKQIVPEFKSQNSRFAELDN